MGVNQNQNQKIRSFLKRMIDQIPPGGYPNFYMSPEYLINVTGLTMVEERGWEWVEADGWCLFPPICGEGEPPERITRIWCDYEGAEVLPGFAPIFFDYEFIFNPSDFLNMEGSDWAVFRKNSRKWPRQNTGAEYIRVFEQRKERSKLFLEWVSEYMDIEDADMLAEFAIFSNSPDVLVWGVYKCTGELVALNVVEKNGQILYYRVCVTKKEQWLPEFARLRFYQTVARRFPGLLVNDGGCLGSVGLYNFKNKMNPFKIGNRFSWVK